MSLVLPLVLPVVSFAQAEPLGLNAGSLVRGIHKTITEIFIPMMTFLALLYVIYAAVELIRENGDSKAREEKRQKIFWGIIGLFVIVSVWALVAIVANSFSLFAGGKLSG